MDSVVQRIERMFPQQILESDVTKDGNWKVAICPHDDYCYASWLYPAVLQKLKAKTVIIFGVAHKASLLKLEDQLLFDSHTAWKAPYGDVRISSMRDEVINKLPASFYQVNDSIHRLEHSVEALIPFLQYYNRDVEFIPILVPYMNIRRMDELSNSLASAINDVMVKHKLEWGSDLALLISTDAVHYGDEEWGGKNNARFGTDSIGNAQAVNLEHEIIRNCFDGQLSDERVSRFFSYTVLPENYKEYQWTWCGRYSVPMGLKTALKLQEITGQPSLAGYPVGYATSIDHQTIPVEDIGMGKTAIATERHWVGYAGVGYK